MKIYIDDKAVVIFSGATVADALRKHSPALLEMAEREEVIICDRFGNQVSPDGSLTAGSRLYLKKQE